jgi:hypothetical protein
MENDLQNPLLGKVKQFVCKRNLHESLWFWKKVVFQNITDFYGLFQSFIPGRWITVNYKNVPKHAKSGLIFFLWFDDVNNFVYS